MYSGVTICTVEPQSLYNGATVIVQWNHSNLTVEPQSLYSGPTVYSPLSSRLTSFACDSTRVASFLQRVFKYPPKLCTYNAV